MDSLPEINININAAKSTAKNTAKQATSSLKAAGSLVAKQAERTKLVTVTLPRAYAELGKSVYKEASQRDELVDLFQSVENLLAERKRILDEGKARPAGATVTDKAKKVAADAADMARMKAIDVQAFQAFTKLGEAVFVQHGASAGESSLLEPIAKAVARRDQLDRELGVIHASAKGKWVTPKRIVVGCAILVGIAVLRNLPIPSSADSYAASGQSDGTDAALKQLAEIAFRNCEAGISPEDLQSLLRATAAKERDRWAAFTKIKPSKTKGDKTEHRVNGYPELLQWYGKERPIECNFCKDELTGKWALRAAFIGQDSVRFKPRRGHETYIFHLTQNGRPCNVIIHVPITGNPRLDSGEMAVHKLKASLRGDYTILDRAIILTHQ